MQLQRNDAPHDRRRDSQRVAHGLRLCGYVDMRVRVGARTPVGSHALSPGDEKMQLRRSGAQQRNGSAGARCVGAQGPKDKGGVLRDSGICATTDGHTDRQGLSQIYRDDVQRQLVEHAWSNEHSTESTE